MEELIDNLSKGIYKAQQDTPAEYIELIENARISVLTINNQTDIIDVLMSHPIKTINYINYDYCDFNCFQYLEKLFIKSCTYDTFINSHSVKSISIYNSNQIKLTIEADSLRKLSITDTRVSLSLPDCPYLESLNANNIVLSYTDELNLESMVLTNSLITCPVVVASNIIELVNCEFQSPVTFKDIMFITIKNCKLPSFELDSPFLESVVITGCKFPNLKISSANAKVIFKDNTYESYERDFV